jgi:putative drug exporter of the RND superfamily
MSAAADRVAPLIRRFSVLIALFWLGLAVVTNVFMPQLEKVAQSHNVSLSPQDGPSLQASKRIGKVFHEFDSDSSAKIVLEGDKPLGPEAHHYWGCPKWRRICCGVRFRTVLSTWLISTGSPDDDSTVH